jgi:aminoglycoside/choline kinase family phosphotransferase
VDLLLELQSATEVAPRRCASAADRTLDFATLRWETDYFRKRFLAGYLGLAMEDLKDLDAEFHTLAEVVAAQPRVLIHRDFQSRNIHLKDGRVRLVDFQGMRLGPLAYDLASLLLDPYVELPDELRSDLLSRFTAGVRKFEAGGGLTGDDVKAMFEAAGLQRLMQALGAFGYLGIVKGKWSFLDHVPAGLTILRRTLASWKERGLMPRLAEVLDQAEAKYREGSLD